MSDHWYYGEDGEQRGPVSLAALRDRVAAGVTRGDDLVWHEGMAEWARVADVPELAGVVVVAPVSPPITTVFAPDVGGTLGYYNDDGDLAGLEFVGFWWRGLAYVIDYVALSALMAPAAFVIHFAVVPGTRQHLSMLLGVNGLSLLIWWLYFAVMESSTLQASLGKLAIGVRVVDARGQRLSFGRATGRSLAKFLSTMLFYLGFVVAAFTRRKQALHDLIATTYVVRGRPNAEPRGFPVQ